MARFRHPRSLNVFTATFLVLLGGFVGWQSAFYSLEDELEGPADDALAAMTPIEMELFWEVYDMLEDDYVDATELDDEDQLYGAIKGMVESFDDDYTLFMTPEETMDFYSSLEGTYQGVGIELTMEDSQLVVVSPLKGSPAESKDIRPGDVIYQIDGQLVSEMTLYDAITNIRGEEGTSVTLTLIREGTTEPFDVTIERAKIDTPSVEMEWMGDNSDIAYINIYQFSETTKTEFDQVVQDMLLEDVNGVVLDLRYNGGGYLEIAVEILSDFLEGKQVAAVTKHRDEEDNEIFYTNESARLADVPLVVLVNGGSASASEILAGALQDYERGLIMGEETFGKGSVQIVEILDDNSSLRMTISKWYTPNDRSIDDVGITPDTIVEITDEDIANQYDRQLESAIDYLQERE